jgi:hypothetical protein
MRLEPDTKVEFEFEAPGAAFGGEDSLCTALRNS